MTRWRFWGSGSSRAKCLYTFNGGFDALAYHLPFAALRTGILTPEQFALPPQLADRFAGFPPLADWVQGGLWRLFGRAEAAALISPLAIIGFAAYGRAAFALPMLWSILIFVAVPILQTALDGMYVDLWTNAAYAVHLLAAFRAATRRKAAGHAAVSMLALAVAVWSKPQFFVVGALSFLLVVALLLRRGRPAWPALAVCLGCAPLAFAWPLRNFLLYGNPLYPLAVQLGPLALPGTQSNAWDGPAELGRAPEIVRYLLSQLDLDAVNARPGGYTLDQGLQPPGTPGFRMGGSLSVLLVAALALLGIGLARVRPSADAMVAAGAFALLVAIVANLPGAHELRYFSFVEILLVFSALCVLRMQAASDSYAAGLATGLQTLLVGAAVYTSFVTGGTHLLARHEPTLTDLARTEAAQDNVALARQEADTLCYVRNDFRGLLLTKQFAPDPAGGAPHVVEAYAPEDCPPGSAVVGAAP